MLHTLVDKIEWILEKVVGILCLTLLLCLFVEVVNRYLFGGSWRPIQYIIPFCFLWMCMLGSAIAVRRGQHFEVDLLSKLFSGKGVRMHKAAMMCVVFAAGIVIVWSSIGFVQLGLLKKSPATGVKMVYIYASLLVGGGLISLMALDRFVASFKGDQA